jgi:GNAT superfamily N-acetyltransferase
MRPYLKGIDSRTGGFGLLAQSARSRIVSNIAIKGAAAMDLTIREIQADTDGYRELLLIADQLDQAKYIAVREDYIDESILLGAFIAGRCVGFLRFTIQVIGRDVQRPPIHDANGQPLREGYVEAFAVIPSERHHGIGQRLQEHVLALCMQRSCYQVRSRSPITSQENYALKLKMGYAVHPSRENDSYYFIKTLTHG